MEDTKMDLKEVRLKGVELLYLVQDMNKWRVLVNTVTNHGAP
jgi:hypothetical protein